MRHVVTDCELLSDKKGSWCTSQHFWHALNVNNWYGFVSEPLSPFVVAFMHRHAYWLGTLHISRRSCVADLKRENWWKARAVQWILKCHDLGSVTQFAPGSHLLIYWSKCVINENNGGVRAEPSFFISNFLPVGMSGRCAQDWAWANIDTTHLCVLG